MKTIEEMAFDELVEKLASERLEATIDDLAKEKIASYTAMAHNQEFMDQGMHVILADAFQKRASLGSFVGGLGGAIRAGASGARKSVGGLISGAPKVPPPSGGAAPGLWDRMSGTLSKGWQEGAALGTGDAAARSATFRNVAVGAGTLGGAGALGGYGAYKGLFGGRGGQY